MIKNVIALLMVLVLIETCEVNKSLRLSGAEFLFSPWYPNFATVFFMGIAAFFRMNSPKEASRFALGICLGTIIYEYLQLHIVERTFDVYDIIASVVGYIAFNCILYYSKLTSLVSSPLK